MKEQKKNSRGLFAYCSLVFGFNKMCLINLLGLTCVRETFFPQIAECSFLIHDVGLQKKSRTALAPVRERSYPGKTNNHGNFYIQAVPDNTEV